MHSVGGASATKVPLRTFSEHWVNDSEFAGAVRLHPKSKDPMIGTQDPAVGHTLHQGATSAE